MTFDLIVRHANLADGRTDIDIAVTSGRIVAVEAGIEGNAARVIEAGGKLVSPPFIDIHFHMDATLSLGTPRLNHSGTLLEGIQLWGELKPLLGMPTSAGVHLSGGLADPALPKGGKTIRRPDLDAARLEAKAANGDIAVEQSKRREDVEAGVFAAAERSEDAPEGLDTEAIVGLRFKIPLPFWNKNEGAIDEAVARSERKDKEADALAQNIRHEAATARAEMEQWAAMIGELDGKLLPLAKQQSEQTEAAWRNGQGELQVVLRSREQSLELSAARLDALREFHLARVRYEAATGNP